MSPSYGLRAVARCAAAVRTSSDASSLAFSSAERYVLANLRPTARRPPVSSVGASNDKGRSALNDAGTSTP